VNNTLRSALLASAEANCNSLPADVQTAFNYARVGLTQPMYKTAEVAALVAAALAVVAAKAGASVLGDMTASCAALNSAAAIVTSAGGE
jgi:hypothetical protein